MQKLFVIPLLVFFCGLSNGLAQKAEQMLTLEDSASYIIGMRFGSQLKKSAEEDSIAFNLILIQSGLQSVFTDKDVQLTDSVSEATLLRFQTMMMAKMQAREQRAKQEQMQQAGPNKAKGDVFLAENKNKPGVITTASGLQYIVEREGSGESPSSTDLVSVHYRGTFIDGTLFDESKGNPVEFPVNGVIAGWVEALQLMKPGAKFKLFIPSDLAYGVNGAPGGRIGPNETLIFEVELLSFKKH